MHDQNLWEGVLNSISKHVDEKLVNTWLRPAEIATRGGEVTITVPNKFYKNWVEKNYLITIKNVLQEEYGIDSPVCVEVRAAPTVPTKPEASGAKAAAAPRQSFASLDSIFTFDNFINGDSNNFAYNAALAVSEGNFNIYNPLYIYGGTGLGKTHLMYAVANKIREKFPKMTTLYMTSEQFANEILSAFRNGDRDQMQNRIESAKDRFKSVDLFMFDDIQFLKDKERTREIFFNIFNDLHLHQKQIVITSDESPQVIHMEERMRSRFASGFQAEINPPGLEERVAILMQKSEEMGFSIGSTLAFYLAENVATKNVRELIGALKRVHLYASVQRAEMSVEIAEKALRDSGQLKPINKVASPEQLIAVVVETYNIKLSDLVSKKRTHSIVVPRQVAMYLMRERLNLSLKEIGGHFGGRDHSTVKYAVDSVKSQLENDQYLGDIIARIEKKTFG